MTGRGAAPLEKSLTRLALDPPQSLAERIFVSFAEIPSFAGPLYVAWSETGVCSVATRRLVGEAAFGEEVRRRLGRPLVESDELPKGLLEAAQSGTARQLRFDLSGLSPFEVDVLAATSEIPKGEVRPYAWVAAVIGRPKAVRAVGSALGRNPVPILIPCHRVTRSDGSLGQYGLGGTPMKAEILRAESVNLDELLDLAKRGVHYVGCTSTKVVCFPSCRSLRRSANSKRIGFSSLEAALSAGYRACRRCRPEAALSA